MPDLWQNALGAADEQIAYWQAEGLSPEMALTALEAVTEAQMWAAVRVRLAAAWMTMGATQGRSPRSSAAREINEIRVAAELGGARDKNREAADD